MCSCTTWAGWWCWLAWQDFVLYLPLVCVLVWCVEVHRYGIKGSCAQHCLLSKLKAGEKQHTHTHIHINIHTHTRILPLFLYTSPSSSPTRGFSHTVPTHWQRTQARKKDRRTGYLLFVLLYIVSVFASQSIFVVSCILCALPFSFLCVSGRVCVPLHFSLVAEAVPHIPFLVSSLLLPARTSPPPPSSRPSYQQRQKTESLASSLSVCCCFSLVRWCCLCFLLAPPPPPRSNASHCRSVWLSAPCHSLYSVSSRTGVCTSSAVW